MNCLFVCLIYTTLHVTSNTFIKFANIVKMCKHTKQEIQRPVDIFWTTENICSHTTVCSDIVYIFWLVFNKLILFAFFLHRWLTGNFCCFSSDLTNCEWAASRLFFFSFSDKKNARLIRDTRSLYIAAAKMKNTSNFEAICFKHNDVVICESDELHLNRRVFM